jgi:hypothetical protein
MACRHVVVVGEWVAPGILMPFQLVNPVVMPGLLAASRCFCISLMFCHMRHLPHRGRVVMLTCFHVAIFLLLRVLDALVDT